METPETFVAYAAGFFDGEGNIVMGTTVLKGRSYRRCGISINQRHDRAGVLLEMQATFGGRIYPEQSSRLSTHPTTRWTIQDKKGVRAFLTAVQPHLRVKLDQAEAALKWIEEDRSKWATTK